MRTMRTTKNNSRLRRFVVETLERRETPAAFTPGNLVIYRVGTGAAALAAVSTAVFLDEYSPAGTLVQSIPLPTAAAPFLTASGSSTSEGQLAVSPDGQYLTLVGYNAAPGVAAIAGTTSAANNRIAGIAKFDGTIDLSTSLTDYASAGSPRGAITTNGMDIWVSGSTGGTRYTTKNSTTSTQLSASPTNVRGLNVYNNQLFISSGSTPFRLASVGTGLPTASGQTTTNLPGIDTITLTSPYAFILADLTASVPGLDTMYVADDGAVATSGIKKYSFFGGTWVSNGNVTVTGSALRGLTGSNVGNTVTLFGSTPTSLVTFTDTTGYNVTINAGTPAVLSTSGANTAFRGLAFVPQAAAKNATVTSITAPVTETNAASVTFTSTYSAAVSNVTAANFSLTTTGTVSGTIGAPTGGGNNWTIPVTGITGYGTIRLNFNDPTGVTPPVTNSPYNGATVLIAPTNATLDVVAGNTVFAAGLATTNNTTVNVTGGTYVVNDTLTTITLTANAIAAGWTGGGTNTVMGPDANVSQFSAFEGSGADNFTLQNATDPTTIVSGGTAGSVALFSSNITYAGNVTVSGFDTTFQSGGTTLTIDNLSISGKTIGTNAGPITTKSLTATALAGVGGVIWNESDGASFTLGATGAGNISVTNTTGTLTIGGDSDFGTGAVSLSSGDGVAINAALGSVNSNGTVTIAANTDGIGSQGFSMGALGIIRTLDATASACSIAVNTGTGNGDATVNNIQVGTTGGVTIDVKAGSIFGNASNVIFAGGGFGFLGSVTLTTSSATSAIGTSLQPVNVKSGIITVDAGSGGIYLDNSNSNGIKVNHLIAQGAGEIYLRRLVGSSNVDISGVVNTGSGNITLQADDNFTLLFTGSIGDANYSGKIQIDVNMDGQNQQFYLGAAGTLVQTKSTASDAVVINVSASTNSTAIGGATLSNIMVGNGGGITVNCAKILGNATDTARAGFIEMVDANALLNAGSTGIVTLMAQDNYIGKMATPIMATAGTISAKTNSTASIVNLGQADADVFVVSTGTANFSGATTDAGTRIGDLTFTTQAGGITLNGDTKTDTGNLVLNSAAGIDQSAGKVTTLGTATLAYTGLARFSTAGNSIATLALPATQNLRVDGGVTLATPISIDGTLSGGGTLTAIVNVAATGKVAPGTSPGILGTGNIAFVAGSQFIAELNGSTAGTNYDQLAVVGTIDLGSATLVGSVGGPIAPGSTLTIVDNDGAEAVMGTFNGIAEGAKIMIGATNFTVSYKGGDGNDVTFKADGAATPAAKVTNVAINSQGATAAEKTQRSRVLDVAITFDSPVTFVGVAASAFTLNKVGGGSVGFTATVTGSGTVVTLNNFTGTADFKSLSDGRYALHALAAQFASPGLDGDGNGTGGDDFIFDEPASPTTLDLGKIFRIFGDFDGDGSVAAGDFIQFRLALGGTSPIFDFDNDGAVAANDFIQFRLRFGGSI